MPIKVSLGGLTLNFFWISFIVTQVKVSWLALEV